MMKIASKITSSLILIQKQGFSNNMIFNSSANPIKERVMSTPTWPVPYYQRLVKAYPVRGIFMYNFRKKERKLVFDGFQC